MIEPLSKPRGRLPRGTLNYFAEVARCGSVRQAADRLYVAGSAVSRQIAKLERFIGTSLFERHAAGMQLTEAGRILTGYLNRTDRELDRAVTAIDDLRGLRSGEVLLSTVEGMIDEFLPRVIEKFRARFPGITFVVRVESALAVIESVASDNTDIGIGFNVPLRKNLLVVAQHSQPILAVCARDHPLARNRKISLKLLANYPLALQDTSFGIRRLVDDAFARGRLSSDAFLVTNSLLMLKSLVKQGGVVTLLPSYAVLAEVKRSELSAIRTDSSILNAAHLDLCVHNSKHLSSAASEFLLLTKRELSKLGKQFQH